MRMAFGGWAWSVAAPAAARKVLRVMRVYYCGGIGGFLVEQEGAAMLRLACTGLEACATKSSGLCATRRIFSRTLKSAGRRPAALTAELALGWAGREAYPT